MFEPFSGSSRHLQCNFLAIYSLVLFMLHVCYNQNIYHVLIAIYIRRIIIILLTITSPEFILSSTNLQRVKKNQMHQ